MGKVKARMMDMELDCDSLTDEEFFAKYLEARKDLLEAFNKDQNGEEVNDE